MHKLLGVSRTFGRDCSSVDQRAKLRLSEGAIYATKSPKNSFHVPMGN